MHVQCSLPAMKSSQTVEAACAGMVCAHELRNIQRAYALVSCTYTAQQSLTLPKTSLNEAIMSR